MANIANIVSHDGCCLYDYLGVSKANLASWWPESGLYIAGVVALIRYILLKDLLHLEDTPFILIFVTTFSFMY